MGADGRGSEGDLLLAVSLRIKAARYLAGGRNDKGTATPMSVAQLAQQPAIRENGIAVNRLYDYEQMTIKRPRRMELEQIADALGVPRSFLTEPLASERPSAQLTPATAEEALTQLQHATRVMQDVLGRLGERVGRRDLQSRAAKDRPRESPPAAA